MVMPQIQKHQKVKDQDSETPEAPVRERRSLLDKLTERLKEFLDNAE